MRDKFLSAADVHELADGLHSERLEQAGHLFCDLGAQLRVSPADVAESLPCRKDTLSDKIQFLPRIRQQASKHVCGSLKVR